MIIVGRQVMAEGAGVHMWNLQLKHFIKLQYVPVSSPFLFVLFTD